MILAAPQDRDAIRKSIDSPSRVENSQIYQISVLYKIVLTYIPIADIRISEINPSVGKTFVVPAGIKSRDSDVAIF